MQFSEFDFIVKSLADSIAVQDFALLIGMLRTVCIFLIYLDVKRVKINFPVSPKLKKNFE